VVLNAGDDEGVPVREIAEVIGRHLKLPAQSLPAAEYERMLAHLLRTDMPASSTITRELMGWKSSRLVSLGHRTGPLLHPTSPVGRATRGRLQLADATV
jgi:nucleoside-diphosphate-sugar epimerase